MRKYLTITLSILILLSLLGVSIYKYEARPKPKPGETLQQAVDAQKKAERTLRKHDAVNNAALLNANNQITSLNGQKATLCTQIKTAKLSQPLCQ